MAKLQNTLPFIAQRLTLSFLVLSISLLTSGYAHSKNFSASDAAKLYPSETTYSIIRKGKNIGKHSLIVNTLDDRIDVSIDSNITVRVLKIPVFKFRYVSKELWVDDQLISVDSTTKTNNDVENASLQNIDHQSLLTYNDKQATTELIQQASNHWNISAVEKTRLFNTIKGVKSDVSVKFVGNEALDINGTTLDTKHYVYSGDIIAQTWYDKNNRWVKLAFLGSDGNQIIYIIDNP